MENVQPEEKRESSAASRLFAVDALRGLIIIFMALDHAGFFVAHKHSTGEYWGSGLLSSKTHISLFLNIAAVSNQDLSRIKKSFKSDK
ncbi:MAG: hypothetical protein WA997_07785 [Anaerolineales bacterium]